jgi:hypothetical protein
MLHSLDRKMVGWIADPIQDLTLALYSDADFAGDPDSMKSTSGVFLALIGPSSFVPLGAVSKKQTRVSHSTPEAELVAADLAVRAEGLLALTLWEVFWRSDAGVKPGSKSNVAEKLRFREDNAAAIQILKSGKSATLRHLGRTHKVCLQWLHEEIMKNYLLEYCESALMCADIFTKPFTDKVRWKHACLLIAHVTPEELNLFNCSFPPGGTISGGVSLRHERLREDKAAKAAASALAATQKADYWQEAQTAWIRHHVVPRTQAFTPDGLTPGPTHQALLSTRKTCAKVVGARGELTIVDDWAEADTEAALDQEWTGRTIFYKNTSGVAPVIEPVVHRLGNSAVAAGIKPMRDHDADDPEHGGDAGKQVHLWEACCSKDSLLGRKTTSSKDHAVTRLTQEHDLTSSEGVEFAEVSMRKSKAKVKLLWISIPCTGGSTMYNINKHREHARQLHEQHLKLFHKLFASICVLADVITRTGGFNALEWPRGCTYWKLPKVQKFLSDYGLVESFFDGCS